MQNYSPKEHNELEKNIWANSNYVCGIDEVGRGCLAGPVVVCALILPINCPIFFDDSKKLSEKKRNELVAWLHKHSWYSVSMCHPNIIDQYNIYQATRIAMSKAVTQLAVTAPHVAQKTSLIISDAVPIDLSMTPFIETDHYFFNKGESYSSTIAAASIVAKVYRDKLMKQLHHSFPMYDWSHNKGYGTAKHKIGLIERDKSFMHREKFVTTVLSKIAIKEHQ